MIKVVFIVVAVIITSCTSRNIDNLYCGNFNLKKQCFKIRYTPSEDYEDSVFWNGFMDSLLGMKDNSNYGLVRTKVYRDIKEKHFVAVGTDYFIYGNKDVGPIFAINSNRTNNIWTITESSGFDSVEIDRLISTCKDIYNNEGGILKINM